MSASRRYPIKHGARVEILEVTPQRAGRLPGVLVAYTGNRVVVEVSGDLPQGGDGTLYTSDFLEWAAAAKIGRQVTEAREALGMTQERLGGLAGTSGAYLSKLERGLVMPGGNMLARLAKALGVPLVIGPSHGQVQCRANTLRPKATRYKRRTLAR